MKQSKKVTKSNEKFKKNLKKYNLTQEELSKLNFEISDFKASNN